VGISATDAGFFHPGGALDSSGDATVVWSRSDGTNTIVQAAGYDADLPRLQDVSIPSSGTVGVPVAFSAKPFDVWPITSTSFAFGDGAVAFGGSATHVYATRGTYPVTVRAVDAGGTPVEAQGAIAIAPSGAFTLGKLRRNPKKGTATLIVDVSSSGRVVLFGRGVKRAARGVDAAGKVKLPVGAVGKSAERLKARGRARVRLRIAFTPDGGSAVIKDRAAVLLKKP
jgi:hypothetical protein